MRAYFVASISLFFVGAVLIPLGIPYAISHFGRPPNSYGGGSSPFGTPPIDWILRNNDAFQYFLLYGIIALSVGGVLFFIYKTERNKILDKP